MLAFYFLETGEIRKEASTGDAWLSSVRSVRSALKWDNERNPRRMLQVSYETALHFVRRKEGQTSSQHGPYTLGDTRATMAGTTGSQGVIRSESLKPVQVRIEGCNSPS